MSLGGSWRGGAALAILFALGCAPTFTPRGPATAGATEGTLRFDRGSLPESHSLSLSVSSKSVGGGRSSDDLARPLPPGEYRVHYTAKTKAGESSESSLDETAVIEAGRTTTVPIRKLSKRIDPALMGSGIAFGVLGTVSLALGIVLLTGGDEEPSDDGAIIDAIGIVGVIAGGGYAIGGGVLTILGSIPKLRWGALPEPSPGVRSGLSLRITF